jgi:hypothetical protein
MGSGKWRAERLFNISHGGESISLKGGSKLQKKKYLMIKTITKILEAELSKIVEAGTEKNKKVQPAEVSVY